MMIRRPSEFFLLSLLVIFSIGCRGGSDTSSTTLDPRIINGVPIDQAALPQVVRLDLVFTDDSGAAFGALCTGTVISSNAVLTAGHCVVSGGTLVAATVVALNGSFAVTDAYLDPAFGVDGSGFLVNDAAIFRTQVPMGLPALPIVVSQAAQVGDVIGIYGYGLDEGGNAGVLKGGSMSLSQVSTDLLLAVFDVASDTCFGDSGGPATLTLADGSTSLVGITSGGTSTNCALGETSSFTNLQSPSVISFIQSVVPEAVFN